MGGREINKELLIRDKPIPTETRNVVIKRSKGRCENCGAYPVTLHHLTYEKIIYKYPEPIFGQEEPEDLTALCWECHKQAHGLLILKNWGENQSDGKGGINGGAHYR